VSEIIDKFHTVLHTVNIGQLWSKVVQTAKKITFTFANQNLFKFLWH